ncbi:MAG: haloacid dehalogenase type II [Alphaproteobacteria bacterium]|jgi:2-haloacid dehalogenase|nr:haloacid dehalogenase type II [Alphaproteobacteria bacterium]MDP6515282.1 haloacid dehalogenase type II [Alphaproteobacteria bacterium]
MTVASQIKALAFDVFGTVVDWRGSISHEGEAIGAKHGVDADWMAFADAWRAAYQPAMERVRDGSIPWTNLDGLHRANLDGLLDRFGLAGLDESDRDQLNRAWHRLDPWPDAVAGLIRLKRKYTLVTLSNGNVALMVNMARRAGLPWDAILGAEVARHYKPQPEAYRNTAELLALEPARVMMVAAHNDDLAAAADVGFATAFVHRPREYGPGQTTDLEPARDWDVIADDFLDLATKLGV